LRALPAAETIDFAFIDADKTNNRGYYEEILRRTRPNGLVLIDNVIWGGRVIDSRDESADTRAIREFNDFLVTDKRVDVVMIPFSDGPHDLPQEVNFAGAHRHEPGRNKSPLHHTRR